MVEEVSAAELHERLEGGDRIQVIDVRPEHAYRRGHIPGAENVPIHRFRKAIETHDWGEEIVIACPHGESSLQAARLLEAYEGTGEQTRIGNLEDGYQGWQYDIERDTEPADSPF
ncbi:MAG: rhodanese-like domain-containing protein [Halobacteriales archaeon]